jgi:phosphoribosylanthranilate isomerase
MFRIKICGITSAPDALLAAETGADAIGLNFYAGSARHVTPRQAAQFRMVTEQLASRHPDCIGVFVNHSTHEIVRIAQGAGLDGVQLHGDEPPTALADLAGSLTAELESLETESLRPWPRLSREAPPVYRARRIDERGVAAIALDLAACHAAGCRPAAVLVDALSPGRYGGTGETVSWVGLADHPRWLGETPLILAGGLTPDNVAEAIRIVRPAGVDVASGVESAPGKKDPHKVRDFVAAARAAFGEAS